MITILKRLWRLQQRVRLLRGITRLGDAIRLVLAEYRRTPVTIYLKRAKQNITIRPGTTDIRCLEKVFLVEEYQLPFDEKPRTIVDAGANIGMATMYFSAQYPDAQIVAIEPEASNFEVLRLNCEHLPNVTLIRAAVWCDARRLAIADPSVQKWTFTVTDKIERRISAERVDAITIGDVLGMFGGGPIDLLKLDIEGSELELFTQNTDSWLNQVRMIAIELHDRFRPGCAKAMYSALSSLDFVQEVRGENIFLKMLK